ncbi:MAG: hypothetical protein HQL87_16680 [Magnetococcales bacterium]|nr:hypothetical protein [Magnetococcales bacterium]
MKTFISSRVRSCRSVLLVAMLGVVLGKPAPLLADALLGVGVVGGGLLGAWLTGKMPGPTASTQSAPLPTTTECRQMETQGFVNGRQATLVGLACRTATGPWQFQGTPRMVKASQEPQTARLSSAAPAPPVPQTVPVYPSLYAAGSEPSPVADHPPTAVGRPDTGRYYGHRDFWPDQHDMRLVW